jgi:hypothetical protein
MKTSYFTAVLSLTCLLGFGGRAHARDNARSVDFFNAVQIQERVRRMTFKSHRNEVVTEATGTGTSTLKEIDFGHHKAALVFGNNPGSM